MRSALKEAQILAHSTARHKPGHKQQVPSYDLLFLGILCFWEHFIGLLVTLVTLGWVGHPTAAGGDRGDLGWWVGGGHVVGWW